MKQEKECADGHCPVHGSLRVRRRTITGVIRSARMRRTASFEIERSREVRKYQRFERRRTRLRVHNPDCISAREGDIVRIRECRPLSKTKKHVIVEKVK